MHPGGLNMTSRNSRAAAHRFDVDTRTERAGESTWTGRVDAAWGNENPNGGYLLSIVADALRQAAPHPDPLAITAHYLRPGVAGRPCTVEVGVLRSGRQTGTVRATLVQDGEARLETLAAMGTLGAPGVAELAPPAPPIPPPDACVPRSGGASGAPLPILDVLDIRLPADQVVPGAAGRAALDGWIRFRDGRPPDVRALPLFADTFPNAVVGLFGTLPWVPTVELTVHLRRRPAPGWIQGRVVTVDLADGRLIEDGRLWDAEGHLVAQSRQLALLRRG